jgi:hypothetical protein
MPAQDLRGMSTSLIGFVRVGPLICGHAVSIFLISSVSRFDYVNEEEFKEACDRRVVERLAWLRLGFSLGHGGDWIPKKPIWIGKIARQYILKNWCGDIGVTRWGWGRRALPGVRVGVSFGVSLDFELAQISAGPCEAESAEPA